MSQISGPGVLITFAANGQQVEAEATRAKVAVEGVGKTTGDVNSRTVQSNEAAAASWGKQVSAVTGFIGKVTAAVGVATTFYVLGTKIREAYDNVTGSLNKAADSAERFSQGLNFQDTEGSLKKTSDEIANLQSLLAGFEEKGFFDKSISGLFNGESAESYRKQIEALEATRELLTSKRTKEQAAADKKADDERAAAERKREQESLARAEAAGKVLRQLDAQRLDEEARINFEINEEVREARKNAADATTAYERRTYLDMIDALEGERERRQTERVNRVAAEERKKQEENDEARRRFEESFDADVARRQEQIAASIQSAAQAMSDAARQLTEVVTDVASIRDVVETRIAIGGGRR